MQIPAAGRREIVIDVAEGDVGVILRCLEIIFKAQKCDRPIVGLVSDTPTNQPIMREKRSRMKEVG